MSGYDGRQKSARRTRNPKNGQLDGGEAVLGLARDPPALRWDEPVQMGGGRRVLRCVRRNPSNFQSHIAHDRLRGAAARLSRYGDHCLCMTKNSYDAALVSFIVTIQVVRS